MSGCGYVAGGFKYQGRGIVVSPVVNKIKIATEARKYTGYVSYPILIEDKLTNEIIRQFNIDGNLVVTRQGPQALILTCAVVDYDKETLRYTDSDDVKEQRLRLRVEMKLHSSDGTLLQHRRVVGESSYYLEQEFMGDDKKSESFAQVELVRDTARRIVEAVVEEW